MKILLAIDESPCAEAAVREVEERFGMQDTTVRVLHVIEKFVPPAATLWYDGRGDPKAAHVEFVDRYQQFVDEVTQRLISGGTSIETVVKEADPGKVIVQEPREWHADLIVLGWHGHGKLRRLVTEDVSQYVIDHTPCSVEIVHQKELNINEGKEKGTNLVHRQLRTQSDGRRLVAT